MTIPTAAQHDHLGLFRLERARLLRLLRSLSPDDWRRPTPCPGWSVLGLVAHLVGGDMSLIAWQRDHHHGTPAPTGADEASCISWLDRLQVEWVQAARRISPRLAVELLDWLADPVLDTLAAQNPSASTAHVSWASDAPVPVWLDQARELTERWIHRQQLLEAIGQPSDLDGELAGPVLDALRWAYPFRLDRAGVRADRIEIEVGDPLDRRWQLARDGRGWRFADDREESPDASLSMSTEQAWRLLTNNYGADDHGPITTSGDAALIGVLLRTRAIIGSPTTR